MSAPPGPEAAFMPDPRPGEVPAAAAAPLPALQEIVEPQFQQALVPEMETSGKCPQDSTPVRSPRLYPPLPVSTDGKGEENTGIRGCAPPGPAVVLMPDPGPGEVPAEATALPPALPESVEPQFWQSPIPAMETSGQRLQDSTSAGPPRLYPPLPLSTDGKRKENTAIR